jgi:outer membrane protein assembly factor BamB
MNAKEILLLGLKSRVAAISRLDGRELWSTELPSGWGDGFVTVVCDGARVFACVGGRLFCLDLSDGRVLWRNDLPGYGCGLASVCLPGGSSAPETAAASRQLSQASESAAGAGAVM